MTKIFAENIKSVAFKHFCKVNMKNRFFEFEKAPLRGRQFEKSNQ